MWQGILCLHLHGLLRCISHASLSCKSWQAHQSTHSGGLQGGNLGQAGMQNFLDTHTCGPTCAALGLAPSSAKTLADSAAASSESVSLANYLDDWHIVEE